MNKYSLALRASPTPVIHSLGAPFDGFLRACVTLPHQFPRVTTLCVIVRSRGHPDIQIVRNFIYHTSHGNSRPTKNGTNTYLPTEGSHSVHLRGLDFANVNVTLN